MRQYVNGGHGTGEMETALREIGARAREWTSEHQRSRSKYSLNWFGERGECCRIGVGDGAGSGAEPGTNHRGSASV